MLLFLVDLINIEKLRISFRFFNSLSFFNFIILRSRAIAELHQNLNRNFLLRLEVQVKKS